MTAYLEALAKDDVRRSYSPWSDGFESMSHYLNPFGFGELDGPVPTCNPGGRCTHARQDYVRQFAWAIPSRGVLTTIAQYSPIVEVGCGTGYWAHELRQLGADVVATDVHRPGSLHYGAGYGFRRAWLDDIERMSATRAARRYRDRALMFVWPTYDDTWPSRALAHYHGETVIYVGEGDGGCTGDDAFHSALDRDWDLTVEIRVPQWSGLHDRMHVYRRRGAR